MEGKGKIIEVGIAEIKIASSPDILTTRGLGSCVGIVIYDPLKKVGALAHPMLPDISVSKVKSNTAKFVNSAIEEMVEEFKKRGSEVSSLRAKLFGGAHMFRAIPYDSPFNIGIKNVKKAKETLAGLGIKLVAEDTGENFGRTIEFNLETGIVKVRTIFHGIKNL